MNCEATTNVWPAPGLHSMLMHFLPVNRCASIGLISATGTASLSATATSEIASAMASSLGVADMVAGLCGSLNAVCTPFLSGEASSVVVVVVVCGIIESSFSLAMVRQCTRVRCAMKCNLEVYLTSISVYRFHVYDLVGAIQFSL